MLFQYPCPDCRTTNDLHEPECDFPMLSAIDIELGYHSLFRKLSSGRKQNHSYALTRIQIRSLVLKRK